MSESERRILHVEYTPESLEAFEVTYQLMLKHFFVEARESDWGKNESLTVLYRQVLLGVFCTHFINEEKSQLSVLEYELFLYKIVDGFIKELREKIHTL